MKSSKKTLTALDIVRNGGSLMGIFVEENLIAGFEFARGRSRKDLSQSGFYFITRDGEVVARTFVGKQEKKAGFNDTVARVKDANYHGSAGMISAIYNQTVWGHKDHNVYFMPLANISRLIPTIQLDLFESNMREAQSFTCVSRQLFKLYNFEYQVR